MQTRRKAFDEANLRRVAMGQQPLKKGAPTPKNEDLDFLKREAGQILTDYISLGTKFTSNTQVPAN